MKHILVPENADVLAQLGGGRVLLAFDFDGTLAPIVEDRNRAAMRERTEALLVRLCALYPCAVISGRSRVDLAARLARAPVQHLVGNHGLEPGVGLAAFEGRIRRARLLLEEALHPCVGLEIEDKRFSLAVHYRRAPRKRVARAAIDQAVASLPMRLRVIPGKLVTNILPERTPNKGDALRRLRSLTNADTALYVGDDVTDEDVFGLNEPGRLVTVRVGKSKLSAAAYYLRAQRDVDTLLATLLGFREHRRDEAR